MAIIASWSGAGLADGAAVGTSTAGTGDDTFDAVTVSTFTVDDTGLHAPRIQVDQQAATDAQLTWLATITGTLTSYAVRLYVELSAYPPSGAWRLVDARDDLNAVLWWVDVHNSGAIRLKDSSGVTVDQTAGAVGTGTELRVEAVVQPDGGAGAQVDVHVYTGDSTTATDTLTATGLGSGLEQLRFGEPGTSPVLPTAHFDEMALSDTAALIGPAVDPPDPSGITAPQVPVFRAGVPVGTLPAVFNAAIRDPFTALLEPPLFRARRTGALAVTESTATYIPWDQIDEDTHTGWVVGLPTRYTVPAGWSGWWHVTGAVSLNGGGASGLVLIPTCAVNGTSQIDIGSVAGWEGQEVFVPVGVASVPKYVTSDWRVYAAAGDRIELGLWYSNESTITQVETIPDRQCRIELVWDGV